MALDVALRGVREAGVQGVAVVSRDGSVLAADLPAGVSRETFSIMCATIHGAGMTVSATVRRSPPKRVILESDEGSVVIADAGRRALIVLLLPPGADVDEVTARIAPFIEQVANETG